MSKPPRIYFTSWAWLNDKLEEFRLRIFNLLGIPLRKEGDSAYFLMMRSEKDSRYPNWIVLSRLKRRPENKDGLPEPGDGEEIIVVEVSAKVLISL